ncbi:hypothetical protein CLOBOL_01901 [Enterocloster bolteae ATCC BAA-613]|uniref:Uncharacterized protein n=1 Tax=Enterocloster bolteae (strain ATCC BAA-613 / DSM 15670 / CCUG 46953 / JCM 12243 / WAL 16351) TaxID=411902 RepID=A8RMG7_ENTBW|nr:hypothetical protein CLOBOL_01901 [Enterocloster bolteae ATCC BAA-613]
MDFKSSSRCRRHPYKMKCARLLLWQGASHHKGLFSLMQSWR